MSIRAILHFDEKKINIFEVRSSFKQATDFTGRPCSKPRFMGLFLKVEATKDTDIWEWMVNDSLAKQIKIQYIPRTMGAKSRIIEYMDAHCVKYDLHYNSTSTDLVTITLHIQSAGVKDHGTNTMFEEHWLTTKPENVPVTVREDNKELTSYYLTNAEGEEIESYKTGDKITLNIETKNRINDKMSINLNDAEHDFKLNGTVLNNDTIKDYVISSDHETIELEVIDQR